MPDTENSTHSNDDRRSTVDPAKNPTPVSPEPNEQAVKEGEEVLERVKPY